MKEENWDRIAQEIERGYVFTQEQMPLYVQELLAYNFWMSLVGFLMGIVGMVGTVYVLYRIVKVCHADMIFPSIFVACVSMILSIAAITCNLDWIKIKVAS